jgi:phage FluMu protein Com
MKNTRIKDCRCKHCQKLLFKGLIIEAVIEIKCKACKNINKISRENDYLFFAK